MTSAGAEQPGVEDQLRAVRSAMDALRWPLEEALTRLVPEDQREAVRERWQDENVVIRPAVMLRGRRTPTWFQDMDYDPAQGYHWRRLRSYLIDRKGRSETEVQSLDDATDEILKSLEYPQAAHLFKVKGLVVGYIQSGKTANFSALIAKGADAGYKVFIVLSGIHNSLRRQTQIRLDEELGLGAPGGVGRPETGREWVAVTGRENWEDFRAGTFNAAVLQGNDRVIMVIKKNGSVLRRLNEWLDSRGARLATPTLVIDDEADQASINTRGNRTPLDELTDLTGDQIDNDDDLNPSVINGRIRELLSKLEHSAYVGYTATPFANVLINHESVDREVLDDLYPDDFILSLERPHGYVGAEQLFGRDAITGEAAGVPGLDVLRMVEEWEGQELTPAGGSSSPVPTQLPPSLKEALRDFLLALAAYDLRKGPDAPAAMLVHTSPFVHQQDAMGRLLVEELAELRQRWRYDRPSIEPELQARWNGFLSVTATIDPTREVAFEQLIDPLNRIMRTGLPVLVLHSRSQDTLDYEADPGLRAVAVGGNKLSRGLTLEGLLVSYFVRAANYFDTLLQMGRWFGYRESYVDITRLWTTRDLADRFRDLATAEEDLRADIRLYRRLGRTPSDFGPRIRAHPVMQITARNRMGAAQEVSFDYSGQLAQATKYHLESRKWLEDNLDATRRFLALLGEPLAGTADVGQPTWADVDWRRVVQFLDEYRTHRDAAKLASVHLRSYIDAQAANEELLRWHVSVRGLVAPDPDLGTEDLHITGVSAVNAIGRSREKTNPSSIKALINPATLTPGKQRGDQIVGLTRDQLAEAHDLTTTGQDRLRTSEALEQVRPKEEGLLLLYPISRYSAGQTKDRVDLFDSPERDGVTVIGLAVALPWSDSPATRRYIVGSAGAVTG